MFSEELKAFFDEVKGFKEFHQNQDIWFRGQTQDFPLHSGLFRPGQQDSLRDIKNAERNVYRKFLSWGHPYLNNEKDWELLFIMQHHGVRTRLLDWTPALLTALYFATEEEGNSVLWLLNPRLLNYLNGLGSTILSSPMGIFYEDILHDEKKAFFTASILPIRNSSRQVVQQGVFTIQGDSKVPLEYEWGGEIVEKNILRKIVISKTLREDILYLLELNGVDRFTVYPDLDGLGKHLNQTYFIK